MKCRFLMLLGAIEFFAGLAWLVAALELPLRLAAQDKQDHNNMHHHYKLIDMETFGGPVSSNVPFLQGGSLNSRGVTVGWSATSTPTSPTSSFLICGGLDAVVPFITHTF